jgi:hypothetical protein
MSIEGLKSLQKEMWRHIPPEIGAYGRKLSYGRWEEVGYLSKDQVEAVLNCIDEFDLLCSIQSIGFGFGGIGINLYQFQDEPYPGVGEQVEHLFCLSEEHLDPKDFPWVERATMGNVRDEAWELFRAARSEKNLQRLRKLGWETPEKGLYDY